MESTGVYLIPIYELLEERGFQVYLVNARQLKNVSGKKTDILDCQWIQQLHTYGLLQPSFRPPEDICALRALIRHRGNLLRSCAAEIQHMQKALQQINLKLTNVLSDITGLTGLAIIRDIIGNKPGSASSGGQTPSGYQHETRKLCKPHTISITKSEMPSMVNRKISLTIRQRLMPAITCSTSIRTPEIT